MAMAAQFSNMPLIWDVEYEDQRYMLSLSVAWADIKDAIVRPNSGPPNLCAKISHLGLSQSERHTLGNDFQEMVDSAIIIDGYTYYVICQHLMKSIVDDGVRKIGKLSIWPVTDTHPRDPKASKSPVPPTYQLL